MKYILRLLIIISSLTLSEVAYTQVYRVIAIPSITIKDVLFIQNEIRDEPAEVIACCEAMGCLLIRLPSENLVNETGLFNRIASLRAGWQVYVKQEEDFFSLAKNHPVHYFKREKPEN